MTEMADANRTIRPNMRSRERILAYGGPGVGKSNAALTIARKCPDVKMWVVDNDRSYDRLLDTDFADVEKVGNVEVIEAYEWGDFEAAMTKVGREMGRDDWLVGDMYGATWAAVQDWFAEQVHGKDLGDYFLQVRQQLSAKDSSLAAFDGWVDWSVINAQYRKLMNAVLRANGHVYCTAAADKYAAGGAGEEAALKDLWSRVGFKPVGQKRMAHIFQTVLYLGKVGKGEDGWVMTTVKDRGRVEMERERTGDFALEYLMKRGGWRPTTL